MDIITLFFFYTRHSDTGFDVSFFLSSVTFTFKSLPFEVAEDGHLDHFFDPCVVNLTSPSFTNFPLHPMCIMCSQSWLLTIWAEWLLEI